MGLGARNRPRHRFDSVRSAARRLSSGYAHQEVTENQAIAGMLAGLAIMTYVRFETKIAFTWYVLIGTSVTFAVAYAERF
jgi:hypothetical protein